MPVYSMTGYAAGQSSGAAAAPSPEAKTAGGSWLGLEIRSVNSRFLDLAFRLPEELRPLEPMLRDMLAAQIKRGKVEVRATVESGTTHAVTEPSASSERNDSAASGTGRSGSRSGAPSR